MSRRSRSASHSLLLAAVVAVAVMASAVAFAAVRTASVSTSGVRLEAPDGTTLDEFGDALAICGDTAVIGSPNDATTAGQYAGSASVFKRNGASWALEATLTASDGGTKHYFGTSVAISGDTIVVGAPKEYFSGPIGEAYVFVRNGATWSEQATLTASDAAAGNRFGECVDISGDSLVVGASEALNETGTAYVYVRNGTTWTEQTRIVPADAQNESYVGGAVAIDGDTLVVGADYQYLPDGNFGQAWVYRRSGTEWSLEDTLTAGDPTSPQQFPNSLAVSGDTVVAGHPYASTPSSGSVGAAYVYCRDHAAWPRTATLRPGDGVNQEAFGWSLDMSGDSVIVGAREDPGWPNMAGSAYVFSGGGATWTQQCKLVKPDRGPYDWFGASVGISGNTALVGAPGSASTITTAAGTAWVFPSAGAITTRAPGADRYTVAADLARRGWMNADGSWDCTHVIVACGEDRAAADPLAAAGLAGAYDCPILLTRSASLPYATKTVLAQLAAENVGLRVHIVGGTLSVPDARWSNIRSIYGVSPVKDRISGATRYDVTANIAKRMIARLGRAGIGGAILMCAENPAAFYDALAVSPLAFDEHFPMLGVKKTSVPAAVKTVLDSTTYLGGKPRYAASGTGYIAVGSATSRLATSTNRYTAATQIADKAMSHGWLECTDTGVAAKLSDSLGGGAFMGAKGGVLLYTTSTSSMHATTAGWIGTHKNSIQRGWAFGGTTSFPGAQFTQFEGLLTP